MSRQPANRARYLLAIAGCLPNALLAAPQTIAPFDASAFLGKIKTVCGVVASGAYLLTNKDQPTFLDLGEPHARRVFSVIIWGADRAKFNTAPDSYFLGKDICVTGKVESISNKPAIVVTEPTQITIRIHYRF